jgi:hypothetical protein
MRTSSSLHAQPPPVDAAVFLFFVMPYSWRFMVSDVGMYWTCCPDICIAEDIMIQSLNVCYSAQLSCQAVCPKNRNPYEDGVR